MMSTSGTHALKPSKCLLLLAALMTLIVFGQKVAGQTGDAAARSVVERMTARYAGASSYQDTGAVEEVAGDKSGGRRTVLRFKTYFVRPRLFRFEWAKISPTTKEEDTNVVWSDGKQTYSYHSWDDVGAERKEDLWMGIAGATGTSRGSAHTVPTLLMEEVGGFKLTQLTGLTSRGEERVGGEDCYVVRGYHPSGFPIDMWIGKSDFLLRKMRQMNNDGTEHEETRAGVVLDGKIPAEVFNYTPPPKPRPKACGVAAMLAIALCLAARPTRVKNESEFVG